ncbi:MAG: ABC transporter permease [Sumerlaeia bacterium]
MSDQSPPLPLESTATKSSYAEEKSYWHEAQQHFFRNKLAVVSLIVICFIATVGVFCPLLANKRPIYIKMVFEDEYDENYYIVLNVLDQLREESSSRSDDELRAILSVSFDLMNASLASDLQTEFQILTKQLYRLATDKSFETEEAESLILNFEDNYEVSEVALQALGRYPLFATLTFSERAFMLGFVLFFSLLFFSGWFPSFKVYAFTILLITLGLTFLTLRISPIVQDEFFYRNLIESPTFGEKGERAFRTLIPFGENENITTESRQPPTWLLDEADYAENQRYHLLGTDTNGRDVLTRMIYGARISMLIGIIAVSIYVSIGIFLGAIAGFYRGWVDMALSRIIEIVICFPVLFLILSVQAFLQPSIFNIIVALGIVSWTSVARLERGEFLRIVNQDFVLSARSMGASNFRLIFRHVLPNALGPILVITSFGIAGSILVESTLSFLGFGVPQPMASWGDLLNNGRNDIQGTWWLTVFPGIAIFLTVTCFNLIGEGVRDALDPKRDAT